MRTTTLTKEKKIPPFSEYEINKERTFGAFKTFYSYGVAGSAVLKTGDLIIDQSGQRLTSVAYSTIFVRVPCRAAVLKTGAAWKYDPVSYMQTYDSRIKIIDHVIFTFDMASSEGIWLPRQSVPSIFGYSVWTVYQNTFSQERTAFTEKYKADRKAKLDAKLKKLGLTLEELKKQEKEQEEKENAAKVLGSRLETITSLKLIQSHIENAIKNLAEDRGSRDEARLIYQDGPKLQSLARKYRLQLSKEKRGSVLSRSR